MKVRSRQTFQFVLSALFLSALGWFVWTERDRLEPLFAASGASILLIAGLVLVGHFLNAAGFWILYRALGSRIGVGEHWMLFSAGQLGNHLPARVGTLYRFRYMKGVHGVPYAQGASVYGANLVLTLAGAGTAGLVGAWAVVATGMYALPLVAVLAFCSAVVVALGAMLTPIPEGLEGDGRLRHFVREFRLAFGQLRRFSGASLVVLSLELLKYVVTAWRLQLGFGLVGIQQPFAPFLIVAAAAGIAGFVGLTPAAFGFREAFITAAAAAIGVEAAGGLMGATFDRAAIFGVTLLVGAVGLAITYPRLLRIDPKEQDQ